MMSITRALFAAGGVALAAPAAVAGFTHHVVPGAGPHALDAQEVVALPARAVVRSAVE
jgi:hypothetical protein